ncbi:MAG: TIGR04282 family arsenosugar biosynthesis glycosyltransferase [Herpetosiphon sp.]
MSSIPPTQHVDPEPRRCLIVVAKQPVAGKVKTRMAATLGPDNAEALYRCALEDTLELVEAFPGVDRAVSYAPPFGEAIAFFSELVPGWVLVPQLGVDFGERLASAFRQLGERDYNRMVLIATDNPSVPADALGQAFAALDHPGVDVVLGSTDDGGYYLIGMCQLQPMLFERIAWSTERVSAQTHERAAEAGLHLVDVLPWYDLDVEADLHVLLADDAPIRGGAAPRTRALARKLVAGKATRLPPTPA